MNVARLLFRAAAAAGILAGAAWWALPAPPAVPTEVVLQPPPARNAASGWSLLALGGENAPAQSVAALHAKVTTAPEDLWHRVFVDGSLRGAELDGGWGAWDGRQLAPSRELRRRFDQLLTTVGETDSEELRTLVAWLAERDLGDAGAQAVLAVWDRYMALQRHSFQETLDLNRPGRWGQVLQEHQLARRNVLGLAWADAFYREEETAFRQRLEQGQVSAAPAETRWTAAPPEGVSMEVWHHQRVAALGQEAADRLRAEERAQAEWEQRLADARLAIERLSRAPELSPVQRQQAVQNWVSQHFQGSERLRASALLAL